MKCQEESEEKYAEKLERSLHIKEDINTGSELHAYKHSKSRRHVEIRK